MADSGGDGGNGGLWNFVPWNFFCCDYLAEPPYLPLPPFIPSFPLVPWFELKKKRTIGKRDGAALLPLFASNVSVAGVVVKEGQWLCPAPAAHRRAIVVVLAP